MREPNHSIQWSGGSRSARAVIVAQWRLSVGFGLRRVLLVTTKGYDPPGRAI
jgi:hypothetical protein